MKIEVGQEDWIISVDGHVIEPPDLWTKRLPKKYQDVGPRLVSNDDGDRWHFEDVEPIAISGLITGAGDEVKSYNPMPVRYSEMRPACYDPVERLKIMDEDSILAEMVFPNFPRFCGQQFYEAKDKELGFLCVQAYNDYLLDEWRGADPNRMIAAIIIPLWDPELAAKEIERCAAKGAKAVLFSEHPPALGLPSIHDPNHYWDPVFGASAETGMPLSMHIGSSSTVPTTGPDAPSIIMSVLIKWRTATTATDWLFCSALNRFPELRLALSEGGISWLPPMIEAADYAVDHYKYDDVFARDMDSPNAVGFTKRDKPIESWPHGDLRPIDAFRKHLRGCFVPGVAAYADYTRSVIERYGADLFMAETDFPHHDASYPHTKKVLDEVISPFSVEEQRKLRQGNAIEWYNL